MNLTRVTEDLDAAYLHFADSLSPLFFNLFPIGATLCDLGSGAGFPGIPLSILRPDLHVVLVDSLEKRVRFLQECVSSLSLPCTCIHARAEEYGHGPAREQFDFVVSRAVARMQILSEWTLPLCRVGGTVLYYKGPALSEELKSAENAIRILGGGKNRILPYSLGNDSSGHQLYVLEKSRKTPPQFPRKGSAKKPLS
jgi:16S rRNA (guanine527-N7)-methyltransferase